MYINAEMIGGGSGVGAVETKTLEEAVTTSKKASRGRHASITSHGTGSSGLGSLKEETEELASVEGGTSTPANVARALSRKASHLSSASTSSSSVQSPQLSLQIHAPVAPTSEAAAAAAASRSISTPVMSSGNTTSSSTPSSSTFFSSFWSRSSNANHSTASTAASSSYIDTPETTMEASPSLSRFLNSSSKSGPAQSQKPPHKDAQKDARSMLSALAASPTKSSSLTTSIASPTGLSPLPHIAKGGVALSADSATAQAYEARSPPLSNSNNITTAALAQLSAVHSSPHLTLSRPRHRASLSESLLRASWSNNNLKADASTTGAADRAPMNTGREVTATKDKGHRRTRHSTSPAVPSLPTVQDSRFVQ
jgi:hypothetical protein